MNKLRTLTLLSMVLVMLMTSACQKREPSDLSKAAIIPVPASVTAAGSYFTITRKANILVDGSSTELMAVGQYFSDLLKPATGFDLKVKNSGSEPRRGDISLVLINDSTGASPESYEIIISEKNLQVSAPAAAGIFRGIQTIRQLLPLKVESATVQKGPWELATGIIKDAPEYEYRGVMLDVSRHFFGAGDIKKVIDYVSYYKLNYLHLHLSDDQGWRIEIKSWPDLALHGGSTEVGGGEGGYLTQEQYSDIVSYAAARYITVVPEIDMPGHTNAALASYAELNCDGKARELYTGTNVGFSSLCVDREVTFTFVDDVVRELASLTPGPYIHIGGDESHATKKEDYITFVTKVQAIVNKYGKTVIGWDEIATAGLKNGSVAQFWAKAPNAQLAVQQGSRVLFSPASRAYLDMQYDTLTPLGLHWAGYTEVDKAYEWDPASLVEGIGKAEILGVEAPLWTETVTTLDDIEYMIFPRIAGIAEIGWSAPGKRGWSGYRARLAQHGPRLNAMGVNFYHSKLVDWQPDIAGVDSAAVK